MLGGSGQRPLPPIAAPAGLPPSPGPRARLLRRQEAKGSLCGRTGAAGETPGTGGGLGLRFPGVGGGRVNGEDPSRPPRLRAPRRVRGEPALRVHLHAPRTLRSRRAARGRRGTWASRITFASPPARPRRPLLAGRLPRAAGKRGQARDPAEGRRAAERGRGRCGRQRGRRGVGGPSRAGSSPWSARGAGRGAGPGRRGSRASPHPGEGRPS